MEQRNSLNAVHGAPVALNGAAAVAAAEILTHDILNASAACEAGAAWIDAPRHCRVGAGGRPLICLSDADTDSRAATAIGLAMAGLRSGGFEEGDMPEALCREVHELAGRGVPFVLHVTCSCTAGLFRLAVGPTLDQPHTGAFLLHGRHPQQAIELSLIAHRLAETGLLPGLHALDARRVAARLGVVRLPTPEFVRTYLGRPDDIVPCLTSAQQARFGQTRRRIPDRLQIAPDGSGPGVFDPELWGDGPGSVLRLAEQAFEAYNAATGRHLGPLECFGLDDAELVLVGTGPRMNEVLAVSRHLRKSSGVKVGVINVLLLNPFPHEAVRQALVNRRAAAVLVETAFGHAHHEASLYLEVQTALEEAHGERPKLYTAFLDPEESGPGLVHEILETMQSGGPRRRRYRTPSAGDESAVQVPTDARRVTVRVEAPGDWSEPLLARIATTLQRLGPLAVGGGPVPAAAPDQVAAMAEITVDGTAPLPPAVEADVLISPTPGYLSHLESFPPVAAGGLVLLQTPGRALEESVWHQLSETVRQEIEQRDLRVVLVDARHPDLGAQDPTRLLDITAAVFEGALLQTPGLLDRFQLGPLDWKKALADAAHQTVRLRSADTARTVEPVAPSSTGDAIPQEPEPAAGVPRLPAGEPADEEQAEAFWRQAFHFYRTGQGGGIGNSLHGSDLYPALLARFRDMGEVRYVYPLWVAPPGESVPDPLVVSLADLLQQAAQEHAPAESAARSLKDNLPRLEQRIRDQLDGRPEPHPFRETLEAAAADLVKKLAIPGEEGQAFEADVKGLLACVPDGGQLVGHSAAVPLVLLRACLEAVHSVRVRAFRTEAATLRHRLRDLLEVEESRAGAQSDPGTIASSFGQAGDLFKPDSITRILPRKSASTAMSGVRLERIRQAEATLASFEAAVGKHHGFLLKPEAVTSSSPQDAESSPWISIPNADSCAVLAGAFEGHMAAMARWFAAAHVARLEIEGHYDESTHDEFFASFDWRNFTDQELALAAPVVLVEDESRLGETGMATLSRLLLAGRPVKILIMHRHDSVRRYPNTDPCRSAGLSAFHFRRELEHLVVAHPEVLVLQSSPVDPHHLADGFRRGLETARPAIFRVFAPDTDPGRPDPTPPFVKAGAALDGRNFPLFIYDPDAAEEWGARFAVDRNPTPAADWPRYPLEVLDENSQPRTLDLAFTFADFAAQEWTFFRQIRQVPRAFWRDEMVPLADYLDLPPDEADQRIPYFWMVDRENVLQRVLPTHAVVLACQDRLNHWHILQELGGLRNTHARRAAEAARMEERAAAERAREEHDAAHVRELERVRRETAGEVMDRLARTLLDLDLDQVAAGALRPISPAAATEAPGRAPAGTGEAEPEVKAQAEEEDEAVSDDPWLETFRCTSCNECTNLNPAMFKYNADKLAYIADPKAGTYAQLVQAAEKCPARCIHPGKPLDPTEPNLEALMKRAEKFN